MKRTFLLIPILLVFLSSCAKTDNPVSGTVTIDNTSYGSTVYYSLGFSFSETKKISTLANPQPDITLEAGALETGGDVVAFLSTNNYGSSFYLAGQYPTIDLATDAFDLLTSVSSNLSWISLGTPLSANQIWIFKTGDETYAKLLIQSVTLDTDADPYYASCTFKWVYQPDGSKTFPE
jgi:hypothetical protein